MKKIFILSFIIFMLLSTFFMITPIKATSPTWTLMTRFDDVATGLDSGTSYNATFKNKGTADFFETSTVSKLTNPNSLLTWGRLNTLKGWLNSTINYDHIEKINISLYYTYTGTTDQLITNFYDFSHVVIRLKLTNGVLYWYTTGIGWQTLINVYGTWRYLLISHNGTNQFNIKVYTSSTNALLVNKDYAGAYGGDYSTFQNIYFYGNASADTNCYWDNFYLDVTTPPTGGTGSSINLCNTDLTGYTLLPTGLGYGRYIESKYIPFSGLGLSGNITNVTLDISNEQYSTANLKTYYNLVINGQNIGDATGIYHISGSEYKVSWDNFSKSISNNFPTFSFGCTKYNYIGSNGYFWYGIGTNLATTYGFKYHNSSTLHLNNAYDGTVNSWDIAFCFDLQNPVYSTPSIPATPDDFWNTTIKFNFFDSQTGKKLGFSSYNQFTEPLSLASKNRIRAELYLTAISNSTPVSNIYKSTPLYTPSTSEIVFQYVMIAPYSNNIIDFRGESAGNIVGFIDGKQIIFNRYTEIMNIAPLGVYDIILTRLGEIITSTPLPITLLNNLTDTYGNFFIEFYNSSISCQYRIGDKPILVYQLDDTNYSTLNGYRWIITNANNNTIKTGDIFFIGNTKNGFIPVDYIFSSTGEYHLYLYNLTTGLNIDKMVWHGDNIIVCDKKTSGENEVYGFIIPDWLKLIFAIIIILFITIAPMLISYMLSKGNVDINIPALVYVAFFFLGLCVTVVLGLLSIIIPFVILIGLILAFAIMWLRGSATGG